MAVSTAYDGGPWWAAMKSQLIRDEGWKTRPYRDTKGKLTIGVGRNLDDRNLSPNAIHLMLNEDVMLAIVTASDIFGAAEFDSWGDARQQAICNMIFNLGETNFRKFFNLIGAIKIHDWNAAAKHALDSLWARQVGVRASRIAHMLRTNETIEALP